MTTKLDYSPRLRLPNPQRLRIFMHERVLRIIQRARYDMSPSASSGSGGT